MSERTRFTAYITKYALSSGISKEEVEDCFGIAPDMVSSTTNRNSCYHGDDWHRTREAAINRAETMRRARLASLRKQIAKIERMSFEEPSP